MSDAIKMVRLDILSMKVYLKSYLIVLVYPIFFSWWTPSMLAIICCFMFAVLSSSVFSVQEKGNLDRLYGVFHLSKGSIVGGRYLFVALNLVAALVCTLPIYLIVTRITGNHPDPAELIFGYALGVLFYWLLTGIQLPLFFRMGYTRARMWSYLPFLLVAVIPLVSHLVPGLGQSAFVRGLVGILEGAQANPWLFLLACLCGSLVVVIVSVMISMAVYRRRG